MSIDMLHPSDAFLRTLDMHDILPQREPFILVDKLTRFDDTHTCTESVISEDNIFVKNGVYASEGMMEVVAQTCAARIGYISKYVLHKGVSIGYIGAIRALQVSALPRVGDTLECSIEILDQVFNMSRAKAQISCKGQILISMEIKIVEKGED